MPLMSKVRITNAQLEKGLKTFGNKVWDLRENSTLFLLENGGGKTSVIQMLQQVVTPNATVQGRKMHKTLKKGSVAHIAIEWKPDDEDRYHFITGFTLNNHGRKKNDKDKDYDYLSYVYEMDENTFSLEELPFLKDGSVTTMYELEKTLKNTPGVVTFVNTVKEYTDMLESYGIFQNEWSNIAKINSDEGGIQGFFENAKTIPSLISRLFVPSLEVNLYGENEKDSIIEAFKERKNELLEIPQMEKNLTDFQVIEGQAEGIIQASESYKKAKESYSDAKDKMGRFHKTMEKETNQLSDKQETLKTEKVEAEKEQKELEYAIASYPVHQEELKIEDSQKRLEKVSEEIEEVSKDIRFYDNKINEELTMKDYEKYEIKKKYVDGERAKLELMSLNEDERAKKYKETLEIVSAGNRFLTEDVKSVLKREDEALFILKNRIVLEEKELEKIRKNKQVQDNEKSRLEAIVDRYHKDQQQLMQMAGGYWKGSAEEMKMVYEEKKKERVLELKRLEENDDELNQKRIDLDKQETETVYKKEKLVGEIAENEEKLESYRNHRDDLLEIIPGILNMDARGKMFDSKERMEQKLHLKLQRNEENRFDLNLQSKGLETDIEIIENDGFYVHPELREVKKELFEKRMDLVLGMEHLLNLNIQKEEKEEIVKANPLISFSIIVEEGELSKLKLAISRIKQTFSIPIFFLKKDALSKMEQKESFFVLNQDYYVMQQLENRLNKGDWESYKAELKDRAKELSTRNEELEKEKYRFTQLEKKMESFFELYTDKTESDLLSEQKRIEEVVQNKENTLVTLKEEMEQNSEAQQRLLEEKENENQKISHLNRMVDRFDDFIKNNKDIKENREKKQRVTESILVLGYQLEQLEKRIKQDRNQKDEMIPRLENIKKELNDLEENYRNFKLRNDVEGKQIDKEGYLQNLALLQQRQNEISSEEISKNEIRDSIKMAESDMNDLIESIKEKGFALSFFHTNFKKFDKRLLEDYQLEKGNLKEEMRRLEDSKRDILGKITNSKEMISFYMNEIKKHCDEDSVYPYDLDVMEEEYRNYQNRLEFINNHINDLQEKMNKALETYHIYNNTLVNIESIQEQFTNKDDVEELDDGEWNQENPNETFRTLDSNLREVSKALFEKEKDILDEIEKLISDSKDTKNQTLMSMANNLLPLLKQDRFEYDVLIEHFVKILDIIDKYKDSLILKREEASKSEEAIIDMMRIRSVELYSSIKEIEKNSYVDLKERREPTVKIRWDREPDVQASYNFKHYIDDLINEIIHLENQEKTEKEIENYVNKELKMERILNCYAKLDKCLIRVWKPRNDILSDHIEYGDWDEAAEWSGGERGSYKMTMFIAFNNLLRKKKTSREGTGKVIIVDNPFGEASSKHVIAPMVDLARKTNTQLFCLTDINNEAVVSNFDTVISNKYVAHLGRASLMSEVKHKNKENNLESIIYSKDII